jgi:Heterokaryon incompatibility protein (HET)
MDRIVIHKPNATADSGSASNPRDIYNSTEHAGVALPTSTNSSPVVTASESSHESYRFQPLDLTCQQIRLLRIEPSSDIFSCSLHNVTFSTDSKLRYKALSYTWGPPLPTCTVLVNGKPFLIRENLYHFLDTLRGEDTELQRFFSRKRVGATDLFWVDQICIDQLNPLEKNHQVNFMGQIYSNASEVLLWLGATADGSNEAMNLLSKEYSYSISRECWVRFGRRNQVTKGKDGLHFTTYGERRALTALFSRPYWQRLWVLQEILLASRVVIYCGTEKIDWEILESLLSYLEDIPSARPATTIIEHKSRTISTSRATLWNVFDAFSEWQCDDPRDKVFGLLSLVRSNTQIKPRYDMSAKRLCEDVIREVCKQATLWPRKAFYQFAEKLRRCLQVPELDITKLVDHEMEELQRLRNFKTGGKAKLEEIS